jgi:thiol-disulfide isomerase/thioredoxin
LATLGTGGTTVRGRVVLAGEGAGGIDLRQSLNMMVHKTAGIEPPESAREAGFDVMDGWDERWMSTPEGRDFLDTLRHDFFVIDEEGRFLINGVPPGDYELAIRPYEPPQGGCLVSLVGSRVVRFSVSEEQANEPSLDLGEIEVEVARGPRVGEPAPAIEVETIDGQAMTLGDLRGRHVLVDFWATWCGPCVESLPALRRFHEDYGADARLKILGLSLDEDPDAVRRFAQEHGLPWPQAVVGGSEGAGLLREYGIGSVPTYVLIGPDGRLLHRGFDVEELRDVLGRLLD